MISLNQCRLSSSYIAIGRVVLIFRILLEDRVILSRASLTDYSSLPSFCDNFAGKGHGYTLVVTEAQN
jgi:hypothetical protein